MSKVVKGGHCLIFAALMVVGNGEGTAGVGYGKAKEVPSAITKAVKITKKNFFHVLMIRHTIPRLIRGGDSAGVILLCPASPSTGAIADGPVCATLGCTDIYDILSKSLDPSDAIDIVHAAVDALKRLE